MNTPLLILLSVLVPLTGAGLVSQLQRLPNLRETITLLSAVVLFIINLLLYNTFPEMTSQRLVLAEPFENLPIAFRVEAYGLLFALVASGLWIVTSIYSIGYMRAHDELNQTRFYTLFAVAIACVMAIAYSDNLFTLFLFYEALTVTTYPLVTHAGTKQAKKQGRVYLVLLMGSSVAFLLPAIVLTYLQAGRLDFVAGGLLSGVLNAQWLAPLLLLYLLGIAKAGIMPLHHWLPSAMVAPTPVSALLHAVAVVKAGVFTILKVVVYVIGPDFIAGQGAHHWLVWLPMLTILVASLIAMTKDHLKERLAYSTISQLSYIVLGALAANSYGLQGASLHIAMHAFAKITLFFAAGAILVANHKTKVSELAGLGHAMPFTFAMFTIGSLSIIGLPVFGGMWSKWYLIAGAAAFDGPTFTQWAMLATLTVSSLLNIAYLLTIPVRAFFASPGIPSVHAKEAPLPCLIGMAVPAIFCIYLFFDPHWLLNLSQPTTANGLP
ncbi:monovalent cation/H+ antiporter subunit D family protein [Alteromonas aestuariivivens]|uniref:Monovalent cation/H+ antiporter subunit D family protein n=1 Tax=Alteromonas aestuariivivens TaxID=1938339 RepID=A0A3D8M537_9ALTE|nr:proton-conducting transporter membrane subunit [Alteromonas aestuariivivens]RDV24655.1 monovalent cation/H+ antiporter subunit D family protein [Alteromonas aestuariivivens]